MGLFRGAGVEGVRLESVVYRSDELTRSGEAGFGEYREDRPRSLWQVTREQSTRVVAWFCCLRL